MTRWMGSLLRSLAVWLAILFSSVLGSSTQAALAPIPALTAPVIDLTHTLTPEQIATLDQELRAFAARKGSQIAILIVPTTAPETIEQYSIRVVDAWKLGRKAQDDGVLLLVAKDDRAMRIEVGYGLEGAIPDAIAKRIIAEVIAPQFQRGDFYRGLQAGVAQIMQRIDGEPLPPPKAATPTGRAEATETALFLLIAAVFVGSALRAALGRTIGAGLAGLIAGGAGWLLIGSALLSLGLAVMAFFAVFSSMRVGGGPGGFGGGGFGGGYGSGGFSGGGGGFGGGGASGRW